MGFKTRYRIWHILLGFVCLAGLAAFFYFVVYHETIPKNTVPAVPKTPARPGAGLRGLLTFIYFISFFYFTLNYYYNWIAANKKFISFLKLTGAIILIAFIYDAILFYILPGALHDTYDSIFQLFWKMIANMIPHASLQLALRLCHRIKRITETKKGT